jgi:hypothetical protein
VPKRATYAPTTMLALSGSAPESRPRCTADDGALDAGNNHDTDVGKVEHTKISSREIAN